MPVTAAESVHGPMRWFMRHVLAHMPFARSLDQAAGALAWMAVDPALPGVGGKYYTDRAELRSSDDSLDPALAARFWRLAYHAAAGHGSGATSRAGGPGLQRAAGRGTTPPPTGSGVPSSAPLRFVAPGQRGKSFAGGAFGS